MIGKRAIAFDIGDKRIGVAVSDPFNEYAMPCETYFRTRNFDADVKAIANIAKERGVGVIVCGMPVNFDGTESIQTVKTREFIDALKGQTELPVELEDERGKKTKFTIVGTTETNSLEHKISNESPAGQALIGCGKGDQVEFTTPAGKTKSYTIVGITR